MLFEEYDYVFIGNEPAGLILLNRLSSFSKVCWLKESTVIKDICLPLDFAKKYGLAYDSNLHFELLTENKNIIWSQSEIESNFVTSFYHKENSKNSNLSKDRKLFFLSLGIWKYIGRSYNMSQNSLCNWALKYSTLCFHKPDISSSIQIIELFDSKLNIKKHKKLFIIKIANGNTVICKKIIINMPLGAISKFFEFSRIDTDIFPKDEIYSSYSIFPLTLKIEKGILPYKRRTIAIIFRSKIPNWNLDILPIEFDPDKSFDNLILFISVPKEIFPHYYIKRFVDSWELLKKTFPPIESHLIQSPIPFEIPYFLKNNDKFCNFFSKYTLERYKVSSLEFRTKIPNFYKITPDYYCHFPYPIGILESFDKFYDEILLKEHKCHITEKSKN